MGGQSRVYSHKGNKASYIVQIQCKEAGESMVAMQCPARLCNAAYLDHGEYSGEQKAFLGIESLSLGLDQWTMKG
jgi:hypothetical protein